jgi:uncharacterized surface protein with fasciclin (FAS1) repeats
MANIVETAVKAGTFKTLVKAVKVAGLPDTLSGKGPFTVFAPSDEAFAKLPEGTIESLITDTEKLKSILTYHVVSGRHMAEDVVKKTSIKTIQGGDLKISNKNGNVMINDAKVIATDIETDNGIIHVIDKVVLPS